MRRQIQLAVYACNRRLAWIKKCEDRRAALDRREMQTYHVNVVMADARASLKQV